MFRKLHRWIGLLMVLQILVWMLSGFYFSLFPIQEIRGEHLVRQAHAIGRSDLASALSAVAVNEALDDHFSGSWTLSSMGLARVSGQLVWRIEGEHDGISFRRLVGPGAVMPRLDAEQARSKAREWLRAKSEPVATKWLEQSPVGGEFRGGALPVWKVSFEQPESVSLYLHPWTGELLATRTSRWRLFDFFWMLHIMDFDGRENFNHLLLQAAAFLGFVVAFSGLVFWLLTTRLLRRGNSRVPG
ncbi:MAG: PepSY domain-containing protein [Xanthomonadales bacterium]|nr:PepSY domain-containing protein [Xanthomonadales bacterium]